MNDNIIIVLPKTCHFPAALVISLLYMELKVISSQKRKGFPPFPSLISLHH